MPSRMRTRNKPAKDQPSNKRPKRGVDNNATDAPTETAKTPNKTAEKRKSTRDTPTKGKKRANIDMDTDNDGSEEKEKRKRTDVSFIFDINFICNFRDFHCISYTFVSRRVPLRA